jgi:hypothetical protein
LAARYWKQYIRGTRPGIGPYTQHIYVVNDNPWGFGKMIGGRPVEEQALVLSQVGPLLIVGHMKPESFSDGEKIIWRRSRIETSGRILVPLREWLMGYSGAANQNIPVPFADLLGSFQAWVIGEGAAWHQSELDKQSEA